MTRPTKAQTTFVINKAKQKVLKKINDIKNKHTVPAVKLTFKEKYDLIMAGKVKFKKTAGYYFESCFDFSKYEPDAYLPTKEKKKVESLQKSFETFEASVILSDREDLAKMLEDFSKTL